MSLVCDALAGLGIRPGFCAETVEQPRISGTTQQTEDPVARSFVEALVYGTETQSTLACTRELPDLPPLPTGETVDDDSVDDDIADDDTTDDDIADDDIISDDDTTDDDIADDDTIDDDIADDDTIGDDDTIDDDIADDDTIGDDDIVSDDDTVDDDIADDDTIDDDVADDDSIGDDDIISDDDTVDDDIADDDIVSDDDTVDDDIADDDTETWECQHSGEEPACYFNVDFADTIAKEGEAYRLLVGLNYDIRPEQETDRLDYVIRTDRDYLQASAPLSSSSGRLCEEVFVYDNPTIEPDSAPLYLQGFQGASPDYYEAGPYTIAVPPPSEVAPVCETADSSLAAYQAALANPFFLHVPIVDSTGNRLVIPEDAAYSGAFFQEGNVTLEDLLAFETATGTHPAIVVLYTDYVQGFPQTSVDSIVAYGSIPWLKVMPMDWNQPAIDAFPMEDGLTGGHDTQMDDIITGVTGTAGPVLVTMAHEVNLPDFPYSRTPDVAVPYQRYFYDRAEASGAANLNGVINLNNWPFADYQEYIFAHPLVVAVAIDGYNFGVQEPPCWSSRWQTFDEVFRRPFLEAKCYSPESRILIGEISTAPDGGDRGAFYCDTFTKIIRYPFNGFVIFSFSKTEGACGFINWDIRE